jgi:uncharacterized protein (DUF1778 family)
MNNEYIGTGFRSGRCFITVDIGHGGLFRLDINISMRYIQGILQEIKMTTAVKKASNATTIRFDDDYTRQVIDMAAELLNQTRTGFLLSVARERAESVIRERKQTMGEIKTLMLSPEASLDIAKTLDNPPKPNKALKRAMKDYEQANIRRG